MLTKSQLSAHLSGDPELLQRARARWGDLLQIYDDYVQVGKGLEPVAYLVSERLRKSEAVHSLRFRLKDPIHVIAKVLRREKEQPGLRITVQNYREHITDLVGVRALHLTKKDWELIHDHVDAEFKGHRRPVAHIRRGDTCECIEAYRRRGCDLYEHPFGYRSVHYVVSVRLDGEAYLVEIQVRTLFEEAWSEIDHLLRYPYNNGGQELERVMAALSKLVGLADLLASEARSQSHGPAKTELDIQTQRTEEAQRQIIARSMARIEGRQWSFPSEDAMPWEVDYTARELDSLPPARPGSNGSQRRWSPR